MDSELGKQGKDEVVAYFKGPSTRHYIVSTEK
jgi:hypothetical protein